MSKNKQTVKQKEKNSNNGILFGILISLGIIIIILGVCDIALVLHRSTNKKDEIGTILQSPNEQNYDIFIVPEDDSILAHDAAFGEFWNKIQVDVPAPYNDIELAVGNYKIFFDEGDTAQFYSDYALTIEDISTGETKLAKKVYSNEIAVDGNLIFYFVEDDESDRIQFMSYNLADGTESKLSFPYNEFLVYSMIVYDDKLYAGIAIQDPGYDYTNEYGIVEYDIANDSGRLFTPLDIRYLRGAFLKTDDGFLTCVASKVYLIDFDGNAEVVYEYDRPYYGLSGGIFKISDTVYELFINGPSRSGSYRETRGYVDIDSSNGFKQVNEFID